MKTSKKVTFHFLFKGKYPKKVGQPTLLSEEEEKALASLVELTCEWQVPMDKTDLRYLVQDYLNKKNQKVRNRALLFRHLHANLSLMN